jgi:hypothetical protein
MPGFTEDELMRLYIVATQDGLNHLMMRQDGPDGQEPAIVGTAFVNVGIDPRIRNMLLAAPIMFQHIRRMEDAWTALTQVGDADPTLAKLAEDMALSCRMALEWAVNGVETLRNKIQADDRSKRIDKPDR